MSRPAQQVLNEYLQEIRQLDEYLEAKAQWCEGFAAQECQRILSLSDFSNWNFLGNIIPPKLANGDQAFGSGNWRIGADGVKEPYFNFSFVERWAGYKLMGVEQVLYPSGAGAVWLGECNNSASESLTDPADAWGCWMAREAITAGQKRFADSP